MITTDDTVRIDQPSRPLLEVVSVCKRFPGVLALDEVSLQLFRGETLAVIGENGAGKSTLMKVLAGIETPDRGGIRLRGQPVAFRCPADAIAAGISLIHQELNLHEELSVAENIFLGREPNRFGWIDRKRLNESADEHLQRVGLAVAPTTPVGRLSTAQRQLVEIAKALSSDASLVIMDEPTSSLSSREAECLFELIGALRAQGVGVVYISHRLGEITRLADRVEVLRDGRNAGSLEGERIAHDPMVAAMVGRDVSQLFHRQPVPVGSTALSVERLRTAEGSEPISFSVRRGEVVGIAGLVGAGRSELLETIFGIRPAFGGSILVENRRLRPHSPRRAIEAGLALVPEDRKRCGLLLESSVRENATLVALADSSSAPWVNRRWQQSATARIIQQLAVKTASQEVAAANLSGGNQQKIALGKWLLQQPVVLMLDEPTRGVDVGAKQEIYSLLDQLARDGLALLFVSSEMEEILALADRVLVMHEGCISGELEKPELNEEAVMRLAVGMASDPRRTRTRGS